jgi:hypothetical protein
MPKKPAKSREYRFKIDAFSPETIPMERLAQYLSDLARMMGESANVHLARIDKGSTIPVIRVDWEAEPKVRERLREVSFNEGPAEARRAYKEINKRLVEDNANGVLLDPARSKVIQFPGRDGANQVEFGPITQSGSFQGILIKLGGENDPVPVHLENGDEKHIAWAPRRIAKQLAEHLFTSVVRVEGKGKWTRNRMGEWDLVRFTISSFEVLQSGSLKSQIEGLRKIGGAWKQHDDPIAELHLIRAGEEIQ